MKAAKPERLVKGRSGLHTKTYSPHFVASPIQPRQVVARVSRLQVVRQGVIGGSSGKGAPQYQTGSLCGALEAAARKE